MTADDDRPEDPQESEPLQPEEPEAAAARSALPSPASEPGVKRLVRRRHDRILGGVAGGLADYFKLDPILFRLGFGILTFFALSGVVLYIACWLLIPEEGEDRSVAEAALDRAKESGSREDRSWLWIAVLVVGGLILVSNLGAMGWRSGAWIWGILLIAAGIWLYQQDREAGTVAAPADPGTSGGPTSYPETGPSGGPSPAPATAATRVTAAPVSSGPVVPSEPPSRLGRYTFAVTLVVLGLVAMLDNAGALDVSGSEYAALMLTMVGLGLLVGSVWGRARGLIFWGLVLLPAVFVAGLTNTPVIGGVGERTFVPASITELGEDHRLFAGSITFDLSRMDWGLEPVEIEASVFMGQIEVFVPEGVTVDFRGRAQMGQVQLFDQVREGTDVGLNTIRGTRDGPTLVLDTRVFMGQVVVSSTNTPARGQP